MSRRQDLERHRHSLGEVRNIMNSMKTLAYMETRKLARFLESQQTVVASIETAAMDFLAFHANILPMTATTTHIYLVIGTEQGFCGDFNHSLVQQLELNFSHHHDRKPYLVVVGHKLHGLLENDPRVAARINGASVVEEVATTLHEIVSVLDRLQQQYGALALTGLYHKDNECIELHPLLPPFQHQKSSVAPLPYPPELHQPPIDFFLELSEQYVFAALHSALYSSLMAENHNRVTHLDSAVKHLDEKSEVLRRQCSALRREEIIEEIEVILLNASNLEDIQ